MSKAAVALFLVLCAVVMVSAGNKNIGMCLKQIDECEKTPHMSGCMEKEDCHVDKKGNYPTEPVCNNARKLCASILDTCLSMLWNEQLYKMQCTHESSPKYT